MPGSGRRHGLEGSWDWLAFAASLPARPMAAPVGVASGLVMSGRAILTGGWFTNTATSAGHVSVFDSVDGSGLEVSRVAIGASSVANPTIANKGLLLEIGCWVSVSQGTLSGTLYLIPLWHYENTAPGE